MECWRDGCTRETAGTTNYCSLHQDFADPGVLMNRPWERTGLDTDLFDGVEAEEEEEEE